MVGVEMLKSILIVEDDTNIQDIIAFNLERDGFKVFTADNGIEALEILNEEPIDLILMDVMMPKMDGFECTEKIREVSNVSIIILTALETENDKLKGFDLEINDYIVKPFSVREVLARIKTQLRLAESAGNNKSKDKNIIEINGIKLNTLENKVTLKSGRESYLTNTEYLLIMFLYQNPNKIFSREELLKEIWENEIDDLRTVDVTVRRLREKIEEDPSNPQIIKTQRSRGYYIKLEEK